MRRVFVTWAVLGLASLVPVTLLLEVSFPLLTAIWVAVPLVAAVRSRDPGVAGFNPVSARLLASTTGVNLGLLLLLMAAFEPWSGTYRMLVNEALSHSRPDTTFAWLIRYPGPAGWLGMTFYSGFVTLYAEELFFRGWLLGIFRRRWGRWPAITGQAALFTVPNVIAAFILPGLQGFLYAAVYAWLAIGCVGGWAADRTRSIWPSLISATLCNLVLTALVR